ncbi:MAG: tetratricopeptide repeat protein [Phormidium sp.]
MMDEKQEEPFSEAKKDWQLESLYKDLAQTQARKGKGLRETEKEFLRGLLVGKCPKNIAEKVYAGSGSVRVTLSRDVYPAIKEICDLEKDADIRWNYIPSLLEKKYRQTQRLVGAISTTQKDEEAIEISDNSSEVTTSKNPNFVGREDAIADLNRLRQEGAKVIVIQGKGGVGKTTLADRFLHTQGFDLVLTLRMAKEKEHIPAVESVIEGWLRQAQKEPGQEFWEMRRRLEELLQTRRVGVLIDNLEPALDREGRFIEPHDLYADLLSVLAASTKQSVTLITSRARLCDERVENIEHYLLPGLDVQAWQQFFSSRNIKIDARTLEKMQEVYGGNAKAMGILCGAIRQDFDRDMAAYWQQNSCDPLVKKDLKNLVTQQFNRLQEIDPEAYKLLCRLGCFRYQDVRKVTFEGLLCLLWDVAELHPERIIESLRNRSLVECQNGEYWLHPVIQTEAIDRIKNNQEEWEKVNCTAADYWTRSVETVETDEQATRALESYYHYVQIGQFDLAAEVILNPRKNRFIEWEKELLGQSLYRLGALEKVTTLIENIIQKSEKIDTISLGRVYYILGAVFILRGKLKEAMEYFSKAEIIANENKFKELIIDAGITIGFCWKYMGELELAREKFHQVLEIISEASNYRGDTVCCWCLLAFLYSSLNNEGSARSFANLAELAFDQVIHRTVYRKGSALLYLGTAYKNLRDFEKASKKYKMAEKFAEEANCKQIIAKALNGLAEIEREQEDFEKALSKHKNAIDIAQEIYATGDLAESYYQQGLTYQKMGNLEQSRKDFEYAIKLYQKMDVPKQLEKVQQAMEMGV